ncbi:MAG: amidohydrolase [Gammaproteobacteria bacterium]|nr:MAG: amidohydrolase [Gammaproteobacteria bacterium]
MNIMKNPIPGGVIDIHTHVVPGKFPGNPIAKNSQKWPCMQCTAAGHHVIYYGDQPFRTLEPNSWDPAARLDEMDARNIARQVLSPMPEMFGYWLDPRQTTVLADHVNGVIAKMVAEAPNRFTGFGTVTLQEPALAVREVERIARVHALRGIEIGSHIAGVPIGDRRFDEFYAAVEEYDLSLFIHAVHPPTDRIVGPPLMEALIAFPQELALAATSLMVGQVLERHPRLRICLSHGGGSFPWIAGRLKNGWSVSAEVRGAISVDPQEWMRKVWYDSLVYDSIVLNGLIELVGDDKIVIGTDYPFLIQEIDPVGFISAAISNESVKTRLCRTNALSYLGVT